MTKNSGQCFLAFLENWKRSVDSDKTFGVLLTKLPKTCDCLYHELLIAKLNGYGFSLRVLKDWFMIICQIKHREKGLIIHTVNGLL